MRSSSALDYNYYNLDLNLGPQHEILEMYELGQIASKRILVYVL